MQVFRLNRENAEAAGRLMTDIRPVWWPDFQDAYGQLTDIEESIETVGWLLGEDEAHPKGWALCRELKCYSAIELECCGYDDNGIFKLEHKLGALFDVIADYGRAKGYAVFRTGMSTESFNIDGRPLDDIPKAMERLETDRVDFHWLLNYGFRVIGIQPNAWENNRHLILFALSL